MHRLDACVASFLLRRRWPLFVVGVALGLASLRPGTTLKYDQTIENMFAPDDPLLQPHLELKRIFQGNDVVLAVYDDPQLLNPDQSGMKRLERIRKSLQQIPGVRGVLSLEMPVGTDVVEPDSYVHEQVRKLFEGFTHGADGRTASIACLLEPAERSPTPRAQLIAALRAQMANLPDGLKPGRITGEPVMIHDAFGYIEDDGHRLFWATTICLGLVIYWFVRSVKWVVIPLVVVQLALLLTNGLLGAMQLKLSMVSSMLTAVVTVVGIGAVMHVLVQYRQAMSHGRGPWRALVQTLHQLAAPIFWACLTDVIGFASLLIAYVGPVREFGLMMALGSFMVLVSAVLVLPALASIRTRREQAAPTWNDRLIAGPLVSLARLVNRHALSIAAVTFVFSFIAMAGTFWLRVESDFTRNFRASTDIVQSYDIVESRLGGAGVCDVILPAPQPLDWAYLRRVLIFESQLRRDVRLAGQPDAAAPLTKVVSLADILYRAAPSDIARMRPRRQQVLINAGLRSMRKGIPEFFAALYSVDPDDPHKAWYRVMLRSRERQSSRQKLQIIDQVEEIAQKHFPQAQVTGYFVLLANLIDSLLSDQWRAFAVSIVGIALIMLLALRDLRLVMIAMVPNVIPITVVMGLTGWLGIDLNMGAAMIAAVSIGLSIDGSIHYLIEYSRARARGKGPTETIERIQRSVGMSMVYTTFALMAGFAVLATSRFIPTVYFGILMCASLLFTLLGTLLWLPLLLTVTEPTAVNRGQPRPGPRNTDPCRLTTMPSNTSLSGLFILLALTSWSVCAQELPPSEGRMNNPFFTPSSLPFGAPDFNAIEHRHYEPAYNEGMRIQLEEMQQIAQQPASPTFENTLVEMEKTGQILNRVEHVFSNMASAHTDETIQKIQTEMAPRLAAHTDDIRLDRSLFGRIDRLYSQRDQLGLSEEQQQLLKEQYEGFVRAGAGLSDSDQVRLRAINKELSQLTTKFQENLLAITKQISVVVDDVAELDGMSSGDVSAARQAAEDRGLPGKYLLAITNTTRQPVLVSLKNRALRQRVWEASAQRGLGRKGDLDNRELVLRIAALRAERARILGYDNYAAYALQNQMAETPHAARTMLTDLIPAAQQKFQQEKGEILAVVQQEGADFELAPWDWEYYAERVRQAKYDVNDDAVRPYFELDRVLRDGVFYTMQRLYGVEFKERSDLPVYHPDVRVFDVLDSNGKPLGLFYADYFARDSKRGGAWMSSFVDQSGLLHEKPVIVNVMNIPRPAAGEPALISFDHTTTMFHEMGHALHGLFSAVEYPTLSGTSVPRDFVEFPSTFHEDWAIHPEVLSHYARHHESGEPIPEDLLKKIVAASKFNQGFDTLEYVAAALLDLEWHSLAEGQAPVDMEAFETEALQKYGLAEPLVPPRYRSQFFAHIWSGGYAASYYAYLWSEVLAADAFAHMAKQGGLIPDNGARFRDRILSRGGSREPMKMYVDFRGQAPTVDSLLIRRGLR